MSAITLEKVLQDAKALSPSEQQRLLRLLFADTEQTKPSKSIEQQVAEQGTRPLSYEEMLGNFWPEDESVDDFLATLHEWRNEGENRSFAQ